MTLPASPENGSHEIAEPGLHIRVVGEGFDHRRADGAVEALQTQIDEMLEDVARIDVATVAALAGGWIFLRNPALATLVAAAFTEK